MKLEFMKALVKHPLFYLKYAVVLSGIVDIDFHSDNYIMEIPLYSRSFLEIPYNGFKNSQKMEKNSFLDSI